jgi:hypothetical protein
MTEKQQPCGHLLQRGRKEEDGSLIDNTRSGVRERLQTNTACISVTRAPTRSNARSGPRTGRISNQPRRKSRQPSMYGYVPDSIVPARRHTATKPTMVHALGAASRKTLADAHGGEDTVSLDRGKRRLLEEVREEGVTGTNQQARSPRTKNLAILWESKETVMVIHPFVRTQSNSRIPHWSHD